MKIKTRYLMIIPALILSMFFFSQQSYGCETVCECDWWYLDCYYAYDDGGGRGEVCNTICGSESCWEEDCCEPTSCHGCTPSCPAGQSTTSTGPLCQQGVSSCTGTTNCDPCTLTGSACYLPENNTAPSQPSEIDIIIGNQTFDLSLDSNNPTTIKEPMQNETVNLTVPTFTQPLTSRGIGYYFRAFEDTTEIFSSQSPTADPLTDPNSNNTQEFTDADDLLDGGDSGKAAGMYYTFDQCDYTVKYSTPVEGFFVVNNEPEDFCNPAVETCDKYYYLPELGTDITDEGCVSETHTGKSINNPLAMTMSLTDDDGNDEIEALAIWFSSTGVLPGQTMFVTETNNGIDNGSFGILIRKNTDWSNPTIYQSNQNDAWVITDTEIEDADGNTIITVHDLAVDTVTNPAVDFTFDLEFHYDNINIPITGDYEIYAQGLDTYQIYGNITEVDKLTNIFDFGFDLIDPTVENIQLSVLDVTQAGLSWVSSDADSGVERNIINGYVRGGSDSIDLINDTTTVTIPNDHTSENIGYFNDPMSLVLSGNSDNDITVNIKSNDEGTVDMYVTNYDYGCNYAGASDQITLEPWIATKGGVLYSREGVKTSAKDISTSTQPETFNNFTFAEISQGTELMSARTSYIYSITHPELEAVSASLVYDSNERKTYWFNHLQEKFAEQKLLDNITMTQLTTDNINDPCPSGEYCYLETSNSVILSSDYQCSGNKLIISEGDITIEPSTYAAGLTGRNEGCIYVAKGNIQIDDGSYLSTPNVEYDYLEGFFIAEGQINIAHADVSENIRDGLEIKGGLVAIGNEISGDAISINRNLRLYNLLYPTLLINYDHKYGNLAETYFGTEADIYKQEVGFKNI